MLPRSPQRHSFNITRTRTSSLLFTNLIHASFYLPGVRSCAYMYFVTPLTRNYIVVGFPAWLRLISAER